MYWATMILLIVSVCVRPFSFPGTTHGVRWRRTFRPWTGLGLRTKQVGFPPHLHRSLLGDEAPRMACHAMSLSEPFYYGSGSDPDPDSDPDVDSGNGEAPVPWTPSVYTTPPVLLFPGLGGSRLVRGRHAVYPPQFGDYMFHYRAWSDQIMTDRKLQTLSLGDKHALDLFLPFMPYPVNYYKSLLAEPCVYPIPYDFRQIDHADYLTDFFSHLRSYIESFGRPVFFLCHSSGGLLAHWFLHSQPVAWRQRWLRAVYNINVPFGGLVGALEHCVRDDLPIHRYVTPPVFRSLGAMVWNMPNVAALRQDVLYVDGAPVADYFDYFGLDDMRRRYDNNRHIIESFMAPTGVETHIVYSTTRMPNQTVTALNVTSSASGKKKTIRSILGSGDRIVSTSSLLVPRQWRLDGKGEGDLVFHSVPNTEHSNVFR